MFNLEQILKNPEQLGFIYRTLGRGQLKNALVGVFGTRLTLAKIANKNRDEVGELISKRDAAIEALLNYGEELANLDDD